MKVHDWKMRELKLGEEVNAFHCRNCGVVLFDKYKR